MSSRGKSRLLLIDDAELSRDVLSLMLSEAQSAFELTWKPDFASGLDALLTDQFDVCLLDYRLGDDSGLDLLEAAKKASVKAPVILLTAHGSVELDREAMRLGAADYLVKGDFTPASLDRMLRYLVERHRAEAALRESEQRYALALEGSNDGLWDWQVGAAEIHLSARWKRILGYEANELQEQLRVWWRLVHEDDRFRLTHELQAYLANAQASHFENEHRLLHRDGSWRHVLVRGKAVRDSEGKAVRMAGSLTDVTQVRNRDPLTGLANRALYLDRLEHSFHRALRDPSYRFALLFIDLDRFKNINDSLGHDAGDELLVDIARRLEGCLRVVDTVARLGGDEFVVLLDESREPDGATRAANRIIEEFARPFRVGNRDLFTGASIGIALSGQHYRSSGELLRDADTAMNRAKALGRGRFVIFDGAMHARALHVLSVESGLRRALESNELEVHYQPVVELGTRRPLGFEALVRWRHPDRGLVAPADFIPVAEDSNLIVLLDLYVLRSAAAQLKEWRQNTGLELSVAVNASRRHFSRSEYAADVQQALDGIGLPAGALRLEVTESVTMDLPKEALEQLQALHRLGVQLYVDDFGVGYSSLSMLHTYPFTGIKLDRSFVSELETGPSSTEVVKAILGIAQALKLNVVAEGIETEAQAAKLLTLGCPRGQGYHFARPMTAAHATTWLGEHVRR